MRLLPTKRAHFNNDIFLKELALFAGTLRYNLDPVGQFADHQIWSCIREANMSDLVNKLTGCLDAQIQPMGEGLSNGEKQAICCIRGLLRELLPLISVCISTGFLAEIVETTFRFRIRFRF